jgi:hypothetical protein
MVPFPGQTSARPVLTKGMFDDLSGLDLAVADIAKYENDLANNMPDMAGQPPADLAHAVDAIKCNNSRGSGPCYEHCNGYEQYYDCDSQTTTELASVPNTFNG